MSLAVALVDYGSGNLHSAAKALERAAREAGIAARIEVTPDPDRVARADRIVLPGVGAFADCRRGLDAVDGLVPAMAEAVAAGTPFLGVCVGMQLLAIRGHEFGVTPGLGWVPGEVRALRPRDPALKVPHMGWNTLEARRPHPLLAGLPLGEAGLHAYFVHSYALDPDDDADLVAVSDHGGPLTAMVARANVAGVQFHPEKSQALGLGLLANFLALAPSEPARPLAREAVPA